MSTHLAVDIGAGSGRVIVATVIEDKIKLDEIHRFQVSIVEEKGLRIDLDNLIQQIEVGIKKSNYLYSSIDTIGIDTWGVDFVALNDKDEVIQNPMFYRDKSFEKALKQYNGHCYELFMKTGIQIQPFNTYFQLQKINENFTENVKQILLLPDYLNYVLTKKKVAEFTNMTTTQCLFQGSKEIINYPNLFPKICDSRNLGNINDCSCLYHENLEKTKVIAVASHDTASAYQSIPIDMKDTIFISSGTWSLIGVETKTPIITEEAFKKNYSNEGSYDGSYRFQKNIMGMWIVQRLAKEFNNENYNEFSQLAENENINSIVDVNNNSFLNPSSMFETIVRFCKQSNQEVPNSFGQALKITYDSIAKAYINAIDEISLITNKKYNKIVIVGGGAKATYLNKKLNRLTDKKIYLFKHEASVIGNIYVQLEESKILKKDIKKLIAKNFEMEEVNEIESNR